MGSTKGEAVAGSTASDPRKAGSAGSSGSAAMKAPLVQAAASPVASLEQEEPAVERKGPWCLSFLLYFFSGVAWVASIPILLLSLGGSMAPLVGYPSGVAIALGMFCICVQINQTLATLCVLVVSFSSAASSGSMFAYLMAAVATCMTSLNAPKRIIGGCPRFVALQCRLYGGYHRVTSLSGALSSVRPGKSFFACHPHGILSVGWVSNVLWNSHFHRTAGRTFYLLDKTLRNKGLLARLFCDAFEGPHGGFRDNSAKTLRELMAQGESVCMTPGAFHEATLFSFGREVVYVKNRRGFVKYCLRHGYRLHPVYTFGESETYRTLGGCESFRLWLNTFGIPTVAFFGLWWCPFMPRPGLELRTFVGEPIECPQIEEPTDQEVAEWHAKYVQGLQALFDRHKAEAGKPDAVLELY